MFHIQALKGLGPEWCRWLPPIMLPPKHNMVIEEAMVRLLLECTRIVKKDQEEKQEEIGVVYVAYLSCLALNNFNFYSHRASAVFLPRFNTALIAEPNGLMGNKLLYRLKFNTPGINTLKLNSPKVSRTEVIGNVYVSKSNTQLDRFLKYFQPSCRRRVPATTPTCCNRPRPIGI